MTHIVRLALTAGVAAAVVVGIAKIWTAPASAPGQSPHAAAVTVAKTLPVPVPVPASKSGAMPVPMASDMEMAAPEGVSAPEHGPPLPPATKHGLAYRLRQYPAVFLASPQQRAAADHLRKQLYAAAIRLAPPRAAVAAGFSLRRARRPPGERRVMWFHSENRLWHAARGATLEPGRPDTLIYADLPGKPLQLVGVMISMPRGVRGPTPGGPITRWHYHLVCVAGDKRGLAPRSDGSCPAASKLSVGSEMMHVWFTRDLRSAFAIHAPWPELCAGRLLPAATCASGQRFTGM
jgi:hypothetical protein